tara:strand:+ start:469 stop:780 length:312 start_codon:yes stop_codon:yes gene_type:complete
MNEEWFKILKQINSDGITFMSQDVLNAYNKIKNKIPQITSLLSGKQVHFRQLSEALDSIEQKQKQRKQTRPSAIEQQKRASRSKPTFYDTGGKYAPSGARWQG